jgi:outer membrane lipoprotein-sorting protein
MNVLRIAAPAVLMMALPASYSALHAAPRTAPRPAQAEKASGDLERVLTQMDQGAANFRSATADFKWDQYQKVVDETDSQSGKIYFRRTGKETQMAADIEKPAKKYLVFSGGKIRLYQPQIDQITEKDTGANREQVESFLVLGFGGGGHDLLKTYEVSYGGMEAVDGKQTAKLELTPKNPRIRSMFNKIVIWVLPEKAISLKQQAFEPSGDNRTAYYSNIQENKRIPDDIFRIKADATTKTVKQ